MTKAFDNTHDLVAEALAKVGSLESEGVEDGGTAVPIPTLSLLAVILPYAAVKTPLQSPVLA